MSTHTRRRTVDVIDRRVGLLFGLFLLLMAVALGRALYLGTLRSGALTADAAVEHVNTVTTPAVRGEITDRNGVPLALSESVDSVIADPDLIKHPERDAAILAPLLGKTTQQTLAGLTRHGTQYVVLNNQVPAATAAKIMTKDINGINDVASEHRVYPRATEAAQVLGWVGASGGVWGLEEQFNQRLAGTSGTRQIVNDAYGKAIQVNTTKPMVAGKTLKLTISAPLQSEVEQVLAGVGSEFAPAGATAIVTDPQTDQILALANWPTVNANNVSAAALKSVDGQPPAVEDQAVGFDYEPGSTFKAATVAAALQDGVVTPNTQIFVPSELQEDGHTITDAEPHPNETLTVADILKVSSNIGADEIGQRLGKDRFAAWVSRFGFGKATGVALPGEEVGQILPLDKYYGFAMYNLPFGQGESVTPMQMVQLYDTIADGGVLRTPQIIDSIGDKAVSEPKGKRIISTAARLLVPSSPGSIWPARPEPRRSRSTASIRIRSSSPRSSAWFRQAIPSSWSLWSSTSRAMGRSTVARWLRRRSRRSSAGRCRTSGSTPARHRVPRRLSIRPPRRRRSAPAVPERFTSLGAHAFGRAFPWRAGR
jgi:cell division protein FtsI/penicillin-binding protein 2